MRDAKSRVGIDADAACAPLRFVGVNLESNIDRWSRKADYVINRFKSRAKWADFPWRTLKRVFAYARSSMAGVNCKLRAPAADLHRHKVSGTPALGGGI